MRPSHVTGAFAPRTVAILAAFQWPVNSENRRAHWALLLATYSPKAVTKKAKELAARGYVSKTLPIDRAEITEKGRQVVSIGVVDVELGRVGMRE